MVDEAHERSLYTDVLLGLLKKVQRQRPDLRVIISSATLQAREMADFFNRGRAASRHFESHASAMPNIGSQEEDASAGALKGVTSPAPLTEAALLSIEGRLHPVQIHYLMDPCSDYIGKAVESVMAIHEENLPGKMDHGWHLYERAVWLLSVASCHSLDR